MSDLDETPGNSEELSPLPGRVLVLTCHGEASLLVRGALDAETAGEIEEAVQGLISRGRRSIHIDMANVSHALNEGLAILERTAEVVCAAGGEVVLVAPSEDVRSAVKQRNGEALPVEYPFVERAV